MASAGVYSRRSAVALAVYRAGLEEKRGKRDLDKQWTRPSYCLGALGHRSVT